MTRAAPSTVRSVSLPPRDAGASVPVQPIALAGGEPTDPPRPAVVRDTLQVLGSSLAVNVSSFLILALAARSMPVAAFAQLSLIVAASLLGAGILDLGTNFSTVKRYAGSKDAQFLSTLIWLKLGVTLACACLAAVAYASHAPPQWICILVCAASLNLWSGTRALEQAQQDFKSLAFANGIFAVLRFGLGLIGLASGDAIVTALAFFAGPVVAVLIFEWHNLFALAKPLDRGAIRSVIGYALPAYLSATFYNAFLYYPQLVFAYPQLVRAHEQDATGAAMFGVLLTFLGPLALFNTSIRLYLFPRIVANEVKRADILSSPRLMAGLLGVVVAGLGAVAALAVLAGQFYSPVYPGIAWPLWIFVSFSFLTFVTGFFNLDVHRLDGVGLDGTVNACRLLALVVLLALFGHSFMAIVFTTAVTLLAGECVLFVLSGRLARQRAQPATDTTTSSAPRIASLWDTASGADDVALFGTAEPARQPPSMLARAETAARAIAPSVSHAGLRFAVIGRDTEWQPWQQRALAHLTANHHHLVQTLELAPADTDLDVAAIKALALDFILLFDAERCDGALLDAARCGVWTFAGFGGRSDAMAAPAFQPLLRGETTSTMLLVRLGAVPGQDTILKRGTVRTKRTYRANFASMTTAMSEWPASIATQLSAGATLPDDLLAADAWSEAARCPSPAQRALFAAKSVPRLAQRIFNFAFCYDVWRIGVAPGDMRSMIENGPPRNIDWAPAPRFGTFEADPMPLETPGGTKVLYEWFSYWTSKGDIRARAYAAEAGWSPLAEPFLNEAFHLSYPAVWDTGAGRACIPECAEAGVGLLYPVGPDGVPTGVRAHFTDFAIADPTLVEHAGRWYLFGASADEAQHTLRIWYGDTALGPWTPHPANPVKCDVHTARPAGPFVWIDGRLYRPSQSSAESYGSSANIMEVLELSPTAFREVLAREIRPDPDWPSPHGIHTLAAMPAGVLIDAKRVHRSPAAIVLRLVNTLQARRRQRTLATARAEAARDD